MTDINFGMNITQKHPWDHDINIQPGDIIAVDCNGELRTMRAGVVEHAHGSIVPRPPMPPWWRPFARRRWRKKPVGATVPVTKFHTDDPFWTSS